MSQSTFSLTYDGGFRDGFDALSVRERVISLLGLSPQQVERIFSGRAVVLKHGLSEDDAVRFCARLNAIGMTVGIRLDGQDAPKPIPLQPGPAGFAAGDGAPDLPAAELSDAVPQLLGFEFRGTGAEYFRIWIVNILLSIVTLGIYSAWAKVRTQRYFYGNTRLDGAAFDYLGDPVKILKGRIIAFALLLLYMFSDSFSPLLKGLAVLLFMLVMPWIVVGALRFRNHNSAWRGIRFRFDGTLADSYKAFLMWPVLGVLTLGLLMPYAYYRQIRFAIEGGCFGSQRFEFSGELKRVYVIMLTAGAIVIAGVILMFAAPAVMLFIAGPEVFAAVSAMATVLLLLAYLGAFVVFSAWMANYRFNHTGLAGHRFEANYELSSYARLMLVNTLGIIFTLGLFYPWAKVRNAQYAADHVRVNAHGDLDRFIAERQQDVSATGSEVGEFFDVDLGF